MKSVKKIRKKNIVFTFDFSKMKNRLHMNMVLDNVQLVKLKVMIA